MARIKTLFTAVLVLAVLASSALSMPVTMPLPAMEQGVRYNQPANDNDFMDEVLLQELLSSGPKVSMPLPAMEQEVRYNHAAS